MVPPSASSFLWQITPSLRVQPIPREGRLSLALIWMPPSPPRNDDLGMLIMLRFSDLQAIHPKAHPLALLGKAVSEIHPYAKTGH